MKAWSEEWFGVFALGERRTSKNQWPENSLITAFA